MIRPFLDLARGVCYKIPMWFSRHRPAGSRLRLAAFAALFSGLALVSVLSCSSDPESSLGSDLINGPLGSKPGVVFQDTIGIDADTVIYTRKPVATQTTLEFGRSDGFVRTMIIQIPFTTGKLYANRTIKDASLRIVPSSIEGSFPARFYRLNRTYAQGDTISMLDTLAAIPDPDTGSPDRALQSFPATYTIPNSLAQGWMDSTIARTAIAVVYTDQVNDRVASFNSTEADSLIPQVLVHFTDGTFKRFYASDDATLYRPTAPPSGHLAVSDGYARQVYFRVRLDQLVSQSAIHTARVRFHIVPNSFHPAGTTTSAQLDILAPKSSDPTSVNFGNGQLVTTATVIEGDSTVSFKLTNAIFLTLQGTLPDNGFVMYFDNKNTSLRTLGLYGSEAPDSLKPRVYVTSSTPATFKRK